MYIVYILYSRSRSRFYVGQTNELSGRIHRHNSGQSLSTKVGMPWFLIYHVGADTRSEAVLLETKIKKRGAKRYLDDIGYEYIL